MKHLLPTPHILARAFRPTPALLPALLALILVAARSEAIDYTWDADGVLPLSDGGGAWNPAGGNNWFDGVSLGAWGNTANDVAIFGVGNGAAGTVTVGSVTANGITFNGTGGGLYTLSGGTITLAGASPTITANAFAVIGSTIAGTGGLTKTGGGTSALYLDGANSYAGITNVNAGYLVVRGASSLGSAADGTIVASGATLQLENGGGGDVHITSEAVTITGTGVGGTRGALANWVGNNSWGGDVTLAGNSTLLVNTDSLAVNGTVGGAAFNLTKTGGGTLTLGGTSSNTLAGTLILDNGTTILAKSGGAHAVTGAVQMGAGNGNQPNLRMAADNQFGPGVVMGFANSSGNWARFDLQGTSQTLAGLNAGTSTTQAGAVVQNERLGGGGTSAAGTLTLDGAGTYVYHGFLRDEDDGGTTLKLNLVKNGTGTQTLASSNITHTGTTTVNAGELVLFNAVNYRSPTTVNAGATLSWSGSNNVQNNQAGATIALNDGATLQNTNPNHWTVINGAVTNSGSTTINITSNATSTPGRGFYLDGGLKGTGTVTINGGNAGSGVNFRNNNTTFSGRLIVNGIASTTPFAGSGIGVGGNTTGLTNADITLNGTMELLNQGIGWANGAPGDFWMGALDGAGVMIGNFTSGGQTRVRLGNTNTDGHFSGTLANGTGNVIVLTKLGTGTQTLEGPNISHTGLTTVSDGTLRLLNTSAYNSSITNNATVILDAASPGDSLTILNNKTLSGDGTWVKTGAGRATFANSTINTTGQFLIQQGTLRNNNNSSNWSGSTASIDISTGAILDLYADAIYLDRLTGTGIVQNNYGNGGGFSGSGPFIEKLVVGTGNGTATFSGIIRNNSSGNAPASATAGGGVSLEKVGTGTQTLAGTGFSYSGTTTVTAGTLSLALAGIGQNFNSAISIADGATLHLTSTNAGVDNWVFDTTISGGPTSQIVKDGSGWVKIRTPGGLNNFQGTLTINEGVFGNGFNGVGDWTGGTAKVVVNAPGTLDLRTDNITIDTLSGAGTVGNTFALGEPFNTLTVGNGNGSATFSGTIRGAGGGANNSSLDAGRIALIKVGSGTQELTGANTYSGGTTVSGGTLLVNNPTGSGVGSGALTVLSGATLGGTGFLGTPSSLITLAVGSGGTLSPGNSPGTLTLYGNALLQPGATLLVDILNPTTDLLVVNSGTVTVAGAILDGTWGGDSTNIFAGTLDADTMQWVINNQGNDPISGTFANSSQSAALDALFGTSGEAHWVTIDGTPFAAFYNSQFNTFGSAGLIGGNDLLLVAIPEPSRALLLALASTLLLARRRRRPCPK